MSAKLAAFAFVLFALTAVVAARPYVGKDGILGGVTLRLINQTATPVAGTDLTTCTVTVVPPTTIGGVDILGTYVANYSACPRDTVCADALGDTGPQSGRFACFECDSDCDCDSDEFCLMNTNFFEYRVCVSLKNVTGKACTADNVEVTAPGGLGYVDGAATGQALTTNVTNCAISAQASACGAGDGVARDINNAKAQIAKTCSYLTTFGNDRTSDSSFTFFTGSSIGSQTGGVQCVSGKCRQCNPWSENTCGGGCAAGCTAAGDLNVRAQCTSGGGISYNPRAPSPNPLGLKNGATELAVGAALVAASAAAALLL